MVFYGIRSNSDEEIYKLEGEIIKLNEIREIKSKNNLDTLHK
jgi:hypothetical protein